MRSRLILWGLVLLPMIAPVHAGDAPVYVQISGFEELEFSGCTAASEEGCFWVCSDENKQVVWKINAVSGGVESYEWDDLKLNDLEGMAGDGKGGVFALCSQSLNSGGEFKKSRSRLAHFKNEDWRVSDQRTINNFRGMLMKSFAWLNAYAVALPKQGGLDLEGIAYDGDSDSLWLGLRGPLVSAQDPGIVGDRAVLLRLDKFLHTWKTGKLKKSSDWPGEVDVDLLALGGLGIRDLLFTDNGGLYILAGEMSSNKAGMHPPQKFFRKRPGVSPVFVTDIPQVPSGEGDESMWSAAEGICEIEVNGTRKLVTVYDSVHGGIYRSIDFPK